MLTAIASLPLVFAQHPLPPISLGPMSEPHAESPIEIVRTWTGTVEYEHLGIGISSLGDVNGDGVPDFILGTMDGAYTFSFGPGSARVISGKDGSLLYEVHGTPRGNDCGDAFGDTIVALGDLDRDGICDFAVGAWRYDGYRGYVTVYSGRRGEPLATIYGGGEIEREKGPRPLTSCDGVNWTSLGSDIVALGDVDGDSVPDFIVGGGGPGSLISGATFSIRGTVQGRALGMTGDFDRDGYPDIACIESDAGGEGVQLAIHSSRSCEVLAKVLLDRARCECRSAGDVDGDGFLDVIVVGTKPDQAGNLPIRIVSGRTGKTLSTPRLPPLLANSDVSCGTLGDVNGDGHADVYVAEGRPGLEPMTSSLWILDGKTGSVLAEQTNPNWTFGRRIVRLGDIDGDGRVEFLVSEYESQVGIRCGGAAHLVRINIPRR